MTKKLIARLKIIAIAVWHAPGVENVVLQILIRVFARIGLSAAIAALAVEIGKAIGGSF